MPGSAFHRLESVQLARIAARMQLSREEVEDVVQETWLAAFEHRALFREGEVAARLRCWLRRVVHDKAVDARRRLRLRMSVELAGVESVLLDGAAGKQRETTELREWLEALLAGVGVGNVKSQHLLYGHFIEGRSNAEVAEQFGMTAKAVDGCIRRLVKKMRDAAGADPRFS